ncbi:MAG: sigma-70 family RNA polymerase sigma factor [Planctomycetaceae bacterium]
MPDASQHSTSREFTKYLLRLKQGDTAARDEIIAVSRERVVRMARKMLRDFPLVRKWEETDDVFQTAIIRLCRSLESVVPENTCGLMRLAARDIRYVLLDLARHYGGPGAGWKQSARDNAASGSRVADPANDSREPTQLLFWTEFHQRVQELPDDLQQVVDLLWYHELSQEDAAEILRISKRTVQRRWRTACISLQDMFDGVLPETE